MEYLYDTKTRIIKEYKGNSEDYVEMVRLSKLESKLLMVLSNGYDNSWEEIIKYMYNEQYSESSLCKVKNILKHLKEKININIINLYGIGFMITDHIYIK